ncbi:hypothetical protein GH714_011540 [Hevea brasiliensis]|uniref:Uncharacterized protein n=1 Tax=Hevea brasiliensis TaxID=3981 RepID=A0A6A6MZK2_HEVBR|nr:hypothetical protein GH714_011540 [Hevea brasiliensis]
MPQCLGNFSNNLSVLHLGMNKFHGTILETFSIGSNLRYLNFNGNQLQGRIPPSISNCINLEILDLGNNNIDDTFPHFLETLSKLQILILKSNRFHGLVKGTSANYSFSKLRIFDLSNNTFSGPLPAEYFNNFKAMMIFDLNMKYMGAPNYSSYDYSVSLTLKGLEIELVKIQTLLTSVDLSGNKFTGEIPQSIGKLKSLKLLNLSHNQLTGNIQPSLGNLSNLESLDLSSNLLVGRIPMQLTYLTFLEVFRVSHNQLEGPIPEGKQFNTFDNTSYEGNLGLCGFPLEKCDNGERQQPTSSKEIDSKSKIGFGWKAISAGYGCGVIFGIAMGYVVFKTRKPTCFVRMVEGERHRKIKRFSN